MRSGWFLFLALSGLSLFSQPPSALAAINLPSTADMPETITVRDREVHLKDLKNPLREDSKNLDEWIREGGNIYFKNCFFCHGDLLDGKGLFGKSFFPPPADFTQPSSVITLPESYAYWRIMKGGLGLPDKYSPWNSAMPAWENQLEEDEVWKVILFIFAVAGEKRAAVPASTTEPSLEQGKKVYHRKCAYCHGETGKGDGPAAPFTSPRPRNFTKGQYKIRTTPFGKIPTDQDLFDMISHGMPGTTMPAWKHLSPADRWSLVLYLKSLTKKFARFKAKGKVLQPVYVPEPPPFTLESLQSGKELFLKNCSGCHGVKGRSDGVSTHKIVDIGSDAIWPRNLGKPWKFRRGNSRKQLFLTLRTGLSTTAMPRFSPRIFKDQQIWDIVHYVQTLSPPEKPRVRPVIKVQNVEGDVPSSPEDPAWKTVDPYFFPLGGQIIQPENSYFPAVDNLEVKAVHNGEEIAFYLYWDDPSDDPILSTLTTVEESPAPPLPPEFQVAEEEEDEEPETPEAQKFPDSIALQFPVTRDPDGKRPYFLNGDPEHPVNLWKWNSYPLQALEMNATGLKAWDLQPKETQELSSKVIYRFGRYHLVIKRKLHTRNKEKDIQFEPGQTIPIAFNVWDGSQGETGTKKAISSWFEMILE
ncbi:MAG: c-type cytochrome [Nitrospinaceae bacterium]